ncbi:MAG: AAA family ATPase, partial [Thermodesulfobacteriota bacterium]|nr:AAA family ATPase [Thermodesulfobacteriota bacterium]
LDAERLRRTYRNDPDFIIKKASQLEIKKPHVFTDQIHKTIKWKDILKGVFNEFRQAVNIIVTGSARLDLFKRSKDSLIRCYIHVNLFPFSLKEWSGDIDNITAPWLHERKDWENLADALFTKVFNTTRIPEDITKVYFTFGHFPIPLLSSSIQRSQKWYRDYILLLIRKDLRDLSGIRELDRISHLVELLLPQLGSQFSLRNLAQNPKANHTTLKNWFHILQRLYLIWPLQPHAGKLKRTIRKKPKWYFLDWTYAAVKQTCLKT